MISIGNYHKAGAGRKHNREENEAKNMKESRMKQRIRTERKVVNRSLGKEVKLEDAKKDERES